MTKILRFFYEVKQELFKITWLTKKETLISTAVVVVAVIIFSLFFLLVDFGVFHFIQLILNIRF